MTEEEDVEWMELFERNPNPLLLWQIATGRMRYGEVVDVDFKPQNLKNDEYGTYYLDKSEPPKEAEALKKKFKEDSSYFFKLSDTIEEEGEELIEKSGELVEDIEGESKEELKDRFVELDDEINRYAVYVWVTISVGKFLSKYIKKELENIYSHASDDEINKYFQILTSVPYKRITATQERMELLEAAKLLKEEGEMNDKVESRLKDIQKKYSWLGRLKMGWGYEEESYDIDHYKEVVENLAEENPEEEVKQIKDKRRKEREKREEFLERDEIDSKLEEVSNLMRRYIYLRTLRGEIITQVTGNVKVLLKEIASRFNLSFEDILQFTSPEIEELLSSGEMPDYDQRKSGWKVIILDGEAEIIGDVEPASEEKEVEIEGTGILGNRVKGEVKIVNEPDELDKFQKGDVLVTKMTSPNMMEGIKKASAMVTDEGGMTCHAVIISRELGVPCIIGTKNATEILEDGDWVEVNAGEGKVYRIEKEFPPIYNNLSIVSGFERTFITANHIYEDAENEILIISVGEEIPDETLDILKERNESGVTIKFIASKYDEENIDILKKFKETWADEIRYNSRFGEYTFGVADGKAGFITLRELGNPENRFTLFYRKEGIAESLKSYFEKVWKESKRINFDDM